MKREIQGYTLVDANENCLITANIQEMDNLFCSFINGLVGIKKYLVFKNLEDILEWLSLHSIHVGASFIAKVEGTGKKCEEKKGIYLTSSFQVLAILSKKDVLAYGSKLKGNSLHSFITCMDLQKEEMLYLKAIIDDPRTLEILEGKYSGCYLVRKNRSKYEKGYKIFRKREANRLSVGEVLNMECMFSLPYDGYQYIPDLNLLFSYYKNFPDKYKIAYVQALGDIYAFTDNEGKMIKSLKSDKIQILKLLKRQDILRQACFLEREYTDFIFDRYHVKESEQRDILNTSKKKKKMLY